jgi:aryl-alcohol dehydrogenase-like predicted oxidoreductase
VIRECETSLRYLKTDYIDLYQIHWHDETTPIEETMEAVLQLIAQGKVRYAGVCNYTVDWTKRADTIVPIVSNQVPYSMLNRRIEKDVVPFCIEHGKSIFAYSPLERGLLTGKIVPGQKFNEGDHRASHKLYSAENIRRVNSFLEKLKPLADTKNVSLAQLVLRWTIDQPGITCALTGARNKAQALHNAAAAEQHITAEEQAFIQTLLAELQLT